MSFLLFVLSWFLPYAIYRKEEQRTEAIRNAHLKLGQKEKNPNARKRGSEAKRLAAIKSAVVMVVIELPFLFFLDEFTRDGLIGALAVATGALVAAVICLPEFEKSTYRKLDQDATTEAMIKGYGFDTGEFRGSDKFYTQPEPLLPVTDQHGSSFVESAEQSGLVDRDAMAPSKKGGR